MSTTVEVLKSQAPYALDQYALAATISATDVYWDGTDWSSDFNDAQLLSFGSSTHDGLDYWTFLIAGGILPSATDDNQIRVLGWEEDVTPALGTQVFTYVWRESGGTVVNANPIAVGLIANQAVRQDFEVAAGEVAPLTVVFTNGDGTAPNFSASILTLKARDHEQVVIFTITGVVTTTNSAGDSVTFITSAANTTTDLDVQVSPARAAAVDRTSLPCAIVNATSGKKLTEGVINVGRAA